MDQPPPSAAEHPRNHDRLNGWKEIASHFGKSVRTVQRWEKELRLPVHRIHTPNGEIVFALVAELSEWEKAQASLPESREGETSAIDAVPPEIDGELPAAAKPRSQWRKAWLVGATAVLAILAWELAKRSDWMNVGVIEHSQPVAWRVEEMKLRVWDASGGLLWEKQLDRFDPPDYYSKNATAKSPGQFNRIQIIDLDGDQRNEVLFAAYTLDRKNERLICYEHDGKTRFEFRAVDPPEYGGAEVHPPPMLSPAFLVTDDTAGKKHVWLSFVHTLNFPSVLVKLSPRGKELGRYWSNGHIHVAGVSHYNDKRVMLVGAAHNETRGTSLAVLDYENPSGAAPAEKPEYRCKNCPPGEPLKFLVFQQGELGHLNGERSAASELRVAADGTVVLNVRLFSGQLPGERELQSGVAIYTLSPNLEVTQAEHEDTYRKFHAHYFQQKNVNHTYDARDINELKKTLIWKSGRFVRWPSGPGAGASHPPQTSSQ